MIYLIITSLVVIFQVITLKFEASEKEVERLHDEIALLQQTTNNQLGELTSLQKLQKQNEQLQEKLAEATQKNKELEFTVDRLQNQLQDGGSGDQADLIEALRKKLSKINNEKSTLLEKKSAQDDFIKQLQAEISTHKGTIKTLESSNSSLREELDKALHELSRIRGKPSSDGINFKDFVQLKRDFAIVKEENFELKNKIKSSKPSMFPSLKSDQQLALVQGHVTEKGDASSNSAKSSSHSKSSSSNSTALVPAKSKRSSSVTKEKRSSFSSESKKSSHSNEKKL